MFNIFIVQEKDKSKQNRKIVASVIYSSLEELGAKPFKGTFTDNKFYGDSRSHIAVKASYNVYGCPFRRDDIILFMTPWEISSWSHWHAPYEYRIIDKISLNKINKYVLTYNMYTYDEYLEDD